MFRRIITISKGDDYVVYIPEDLKLAEAHHIKRKEKRRKSPPSQEQVEITIAILRDFRIFIKDKDIPTFGSISELESWKRKLIKERLEKEW